MGEKKTSYILAVFSILLLSFLISSVTANVDDQQFSLKDLDAFSITNPQTSTDQPTAGVPSKAAQMDGSKADLLRILKLTNAIVPRLTSVQGKLTDLVISASQKNKEISDLGPHRRDLDTIQNSSESVEENGWSLDEIKETNRMAEKELSLVSNMLNNGSAHPPTPLSTVISRTRKIECGGELSGDDRFIYEYIETQGPNCLWIISSQLYKDYLRVTLEFADLQGNSEDTQLSIGYFSNGKMDAADSFIWKKLDQNPNGGVTVLDIPSVVAFLHLVSRPRASVWSDVDSRTARSMKVNIKGFGLSFRGIPNNSTTSQLRFASSFQNNLNEPFRPVMQGPNGTSTLYAPNQRTVIALQPPNSNAALFLKWVDIEIRSDSGAIYDSLNIWSFGQSQKWYRVDQLFGEVAKGENKEFAKKYYFNDDPPFSPMILAFQTDSEDEYTGFEGYILQLDSDIRLFVSPHFTGRAGSWTLRGYECISVETFLRPGEGFSSAYTYGTCVKICDQSDCSGTCHRMAPGTKGSWDFGEIQFSGRVKSIQACI